MRLADAVLYLTTDDAGLKEGLGKAESETTSWGGRLGGTLKNVLGGAALGVVGLAAGAVAGLGALVISGMGDAREAIEIQKQTEAVLKSTGEAAGMTAQSVMDLATSLSSVTNFEDDAIQAGENLLLTFTQIGSDVFPAATETMLDMSQALGQDMKSSAVQLGKALNDPVAGISALSRVGVTFTEDQKTMIAAMVEAGDVAGAQKVILQELGREFGGSARAAMDPVTQLTNTWGNFKESLAMAVIPLINELAKMAIPFLQRALEVLVPIVETVGLVIGGVVGVLQDSDGPLGDWSLWWERIAELMGEDVADALMDTMTFLSRLKDTLTSTVGPIIQTAMGWFSGLGESVAAQTDGPLAYLRTWFDENMPRIQQIVQTVLEKLQAFWNEHGDAIMAVVRNVLDVVYVLFDVQLKTILDVVTVFLQLLTGDWEGAEKTLTGIVERLWSAVKTVFEETLDSIRTLFGDFDWEALGENIMTGIKDGILAGVRWIVDAAEDAAQSAYDAARRALGISSPSKLAAEGIGAPLAQGIGVGMRDELQRMQSGFASSFNGLVNGMAGQAQGAGAPIAITIHVNGGGDGVGEAVRGGVLSALRQAGLR